MPRSSKARAYDVRFLRSRKITMTSPGWTSRDSVRPPLSSTAIFQWRLIAPSIQSPISPAFRAGTAAFAVREAAVTSLKTPPCFTSSGRHGLMGTKAAW